MTSCPQNTSKSKYYLSAGYTKFQAAQQQRKYAWTRRNETRPAGTSFSTTRTELPAVDPRISQDRFLWISPRTRRSSESPLSEGTLIDRSLNKPVTFDKRLPHIRANAVQGLANNFGEKIGPTVAPAQSFTCPAAEDSTRRKLLQLFSRVARHTEPGTLGDEENTPSNFRNKASSVPATFPTFHPTDSKLYDPAGLRRCQLMSRESRVGKRIHRTSAGS